jgi:amino acid transporter
MRVFGLDPIAHPQWADYLAAGAIIFAGITNIVGVQLGALFAGISTVTKFGALALLVAASFLLGGNAGASFGNLASNGAAVGSAERRHFLPPKANASLQHYAESAEEN